VLLFGSNGFTPALGQTLLLAGLLTCSLDSFCYPNSASSQIAPVTYALFMNHLQLRGQLSIVTIFPIILYLYKTNNAAHYLDKGRGVKPQKQAVVR
jgi:hypothetical protein